MRQINLLQNDLKCSRKNLKLNHPLAIRRPNTHTKVLRSSKILLTLGLNIFLHSWGLPYLCFSESLSRNLITSACFSFAMYHAFHLQTSCMRLTLFYSNCAVEPIAISCDRQCILRYFCRGFRKGREMQKDLQYRPGHSIPSTLAGSLNFAYLRSRRIYFLEIPIVRWFHSATPNDGRQSASQAVITWS